MDVAAVHDDQVLLPAAHVQLALVQEAQVAAAQPLGARVVAGQLRPEGALRQLRQPPVALRLGGARDPDLSDSVVAHGLQRLGLHNA